MLMWVMNLDFAASEIDAAAIEGAFLVFPWVWDEWQVT